MRKLIMPWPPSMNRYWRSVNGRVLISAAGRHYRTNVALAAAIGKWPSWEGKLISVSIEAWLPDQRKRDLDNLFKSSLDSLTHAGIWNDDSQIHELHIRNMGLDRAKPRLELTIKEFV